MAVEPVPPQPGRNPGEGWATAAAALCCTRSVYPPALQVPPTHPPAHSHPPSPACMQADDMGLGGCWAAPRICWVLGCLLLFCSACPCASQPELPAASPFRAAPPRRQDHPVRRLPGGPHPGPPDPEGHSGGPQDAAGTVAQGAGRVRAAGAGARVRRQRRGEVGGAGGWASGWGGPAWVLGQRSAMPPSRMPACWSQTQTG